MTAQHLPRVEVAQIEGVLRGTASLVLGARAGSDYELRRMAMDERVASEFREIARQHLAGIGEARQIPFDVGYKPEKDELLVLDIDQFEERELAARVMRPADLPAYDSDNSAFGVPILYATVFRRASDSVALLRKSTRIHVGRSRRYLGLIQNGRLSALDAPVLAFDAAVDVMIWGQHVLVSNPAGFQQMFKDTTVLRQRVGEDARIVSSHVPIANLDEFLDACARDSRMMTKLGRVAKRPYLDQLTVDDIKSQIERFGLAPDLVNDDGQLVWSADRDHRWAILKILDDDYLESRMTEQKYEVNSKLEHRS